MGTFHKDSCWSQHISVFNYIHIYVSTCLPHLLSFIKTMSEMHCRPFKDRYLVITHLYIYIYIYIYMHFALLYTFTMYILHIHSVTKNLLSTY